MMGEMRLYINGILENSRKRTGKIIDLKPEFITTIGYWSAYSGHRYFGGDVDELSVWNVALTEEEIRDVIARKLDGNESGLQVYYRFDEIENGILTDIAGNFDGVVNGADTAVSTAPVGDESVFTYGGDDIILSSPDNCVKVSDFFGKPDGVHIYKVNNNTVLSGAKDSEVTGIAEDSYWGVYVVGAKNNTSFKYTKKLNSNTTVAINDSLTMAYRKDVTDEWIYLDVERNFQDTTFWYNGQKVG
jgi:hypothetical protein